LPKYPKNGWKIVPKRSTSPNYYACHITLTMGHKLAVKQWY